jgi:hypothetical protein
MAAYRTKDARSRPVSIIGPGWRAMWPVDFARPAGPLAAEARAANAIPQSSGMQFHAWLLLMITAVVFAALSAWWAVRAGPGARLQPIGTLGWAVLGLVLGVMTFRYKFRQSPEKIVEAALRERCCPSCNYSLSGISPDPDGCTTCPECGAAWCFPPPL